MNGIRWSATDLARVLGQDLPTDEQVKVIESPLRPLLVVAGAGSGKTETMAARVVWLVANRFVEPDEVLGLTFTRKAASELAERLTARLATLRQAGIWIPREEEGAEVLGGMPTVSTYHAYAGRLFSEHGLRLGYERETTLLTEAGAWQLAYEAILDYDGPVSDFVKSENTLTEAVLSLSGELAEHLTTTDDLLAHLDEVIDALGVVPKAPGSRRRGLPTEIAAAQAVLRELRGLVPIVERYRALKRRSHAMDFADQMALAARIGREFPDVGTTERARFRAVFLDEFQDTSEAQLVFLRSLFVARTEPAAVTAVGDPHQSIYGWRGASATTLDRFRDGFVDDEGVASTAHLSTSWRNDRVILDLAGVTAAPLDQASRVDVRRLCPRNGAGPGRATAARLLTAQDEAEAVAEWIVQVRAQPNVRTSAILCRKRSQFPAIIEALKARDLPHEVVGLGGLLLTPEVSDLVAALWVVQDPTRGDQLMRLVTGPLVRIGAADLDGLHAWARLRQGGAAEEGRSRASLIEALEDLPNEAWRGGSGERVSPVALERLASLAIIIRRLRSLTALPLPELVGEAERALGLDLEVMARVEYSPSAARAHLDAFVDVAAQFSASSDRPTLGGFLTWLTAALEKERGLDLGWIETTPDAVQVMTVHAAKGLEWDAVAIPGLVEATFPAHSGQPRWSDAEEGWVVGDVKDKAWLLGASSLPYDLRGDRDALPRFPWDELCDWDQASQAHADFLRASGEHELLEERRLMYVAITRARHNVFLSAYVWGTQVAPRVTSRFLTELLVDPQIAAEIAQWADLPDALPDGKAPPNPAVVDAVAVAWPREIDSVSVAPLAQAAVQVNELLSGQGRGQASSWDESIDILLAERAERRASGPTCAIVPRHLSTSALVELATDAQAFAESLRRPMPRRPALSARRGTQFHAWVEEQYGRAPMVDVLELPGSADAAPADAAQLEQLKANFRASEWAGRSPSEIEVALETVIEGVAVRGRVDAVFPDGPDGWVIVDWKTGTPPTGKAAQLRALQLGVYRLAWARLRGVAEEKVRAAFFYASTGETVWPDLPDRGEIIDVLGQIPQE